MPSCSAPARWWQTPASGPLLCWGLRLGVYSVGFFFSPSQLCCPLRFQNSPHTHLWEGFLLFENFFMTPSPGRVSTANVFVSLFVFYILSYLLLKRMGCLSGCLCPLAAFRSCFVEVAQPSNALLMNFWGRKWSPHPISLPLLILLFFH